MVFVFGQKKVFVTLWFLSTDQLFKEEVIGTKGWCLSEDIGTKVRKWNSFVFYIFLSANKRLLAPRVGASKSKEILAPRLENLIPLFLLL